MGRYYKRKFGIKVENRENGMWSFGIGINSFAEETYLYVSFYRWFIKVGYLYKYEIRR